MGDQRALNNRVLSHIKDNGPIGGKNPLSRLTDKVKAPFTDVKEAVRTLADSGHILLETSSHGQIKTITPAPKPRPFRTRGPHNVDRTERSPQQKHEDMFAKGVPAYLPDRWCTPVVITQRSGDPVDLAIPDSNPESEAMSEDHVTESLSIVSGAPYHETLSVCLRALREMADPSGHAENTSVRSVLMLIGGITPSHAKRAMTYLHGMELYVTQMTGKGSSSYQLDMSREEVTAEMLAEYRRSKRISKPVVDVTPEEPSVGDEPTVVSADDSSDDGVLERLADIIELQEGTIDGLERKLKDADRREQELLATIRQLEAEREELSGKLTERNRLDERLGGILQRHAPAK